MSGAAGWPGAAARASGRTLRIGHKGCAAVVPGNTLEALERAAELGVDAVEFDALPDGHGGLRLAHDPDDLAARPDAPTLAQALDRLAQPDLAHLGIDLDSKWHGDEEQIVAALRERDLLDRTLVSTMEVVTLVRLREIEPALRLGWSVPRVRRNPLSHPATRPIGVAAVLAARRILPRRLIAALREGRVDAVMAHESLVSPAFARAVTAHGELYAWTVDDAARAARLVALGVTGVISNDPRLVPAG
ncbi:glycerophosphodiester phosphodiesterase [Patulibacter brassicae]|uniref:Glycerophosphodiester phosphodiesterase n=1 Tax=Patulibacter brassicae TaxID=1705717 RepID=A0ABU4VL77_9ACTN|nr:glycerophosphodiester phosphodiesterase [Patulibacter brassicae]MDX8152578.1 glycerophosphodiester phosphodiesterase [Patulibacter brassicae]